MRVARGNPLKNREITGFLRVASIAIAFLVSAGAVFAESARSENKFGTEIELQGLGHRVTQACVRNFTFFFPVQIATSLVESSSQKDDPVYGAANLIGNANLYGVAACLPLMMFDDKLTQSYLKRIEAKLRPRVAAGELKTEWIDSEFKASKALKITYPSGSTITFSRDPQTVEVQMSPQTADHFAKNVQFYDREIYALARSVGLRAPRMDGFWNGGHIHFDLEAAFGGDPAKLKRFLLDYWSHDELARGILVNDSFNAGPLKGEKQIAQAKKLAQYLDELSARKEKLTKLTLYEILERYERVMHKFSPMGLTSSALRVHPDIGTLEVRALRSQASATKLALITRLLDARIRYTNALPDSAFSTENLGIKARTQREKIMAFRKYVEETGLNFEEFKPLVPEKYLAADPLSNESRWACAKRRLAESLSRQR